jgi:hypothetical protein
MRAFSSTIISSTQSALTALLSTRERHISQLAAAVPATSTTSTDISSSSALGGSSSWQRPPLARAAILCTVDSRPYLRRQHALAPRSNAMHHRLSTPPRTHRALPAELSAEPHERKTVSYKYGPFRGRIPTKRRLRRSVSQSRRNRTGSCRHHQSAFAGLLPDEDATTNYGPFQGRQSGALEWHFNSDRRTFVTV